MASQFKWTRKNYQKVSSSLQRAKITKSSTQSANYHKAVTRSVSMYLCYYFVFSDEKISALINKNDRLRIEINKIQKVLNQAAQREKVKPQYGIKLPEIRSEVAGRQLDNAYKQIKAYESEIEKLKNIENQGTFATRLTKAERNLKQRQQLKDRLKGELQKLHKSAKHITMSLTDDRNKILLQNKSKKLNDQLKMYEKKWTQDERKRHFFMQTQKKKSQYVHELQKKLSGAGVSLLQVQQARRRIFQAPSKVGKNQNDLQKQQIQDRSPQVYESFLSELKLLRKVTVTNQKLLEKLQLEKDEFSLKNRKTKIQLQETQKEIQMVQTELIFLKKHIDPQKIKPLLSKKTSFNARITYNSNSVSMSDDKSIIDPLSNKSKDMLDHHFQFIQIGVISRRSEKFNDRKLLGKRSAKIVAVQLHQNRMQLLGFRFTYLIKEDQKVQGTLMQIKNDNQRYLQKKELNLTNNDFFVSIQCFISPKNMIVGIIMISQTGKIIKGGSFEGQKRFLEMSSKQYPGCVYSCISKEGIELIGVEKVQPQSF